MSILYKNIHSDWFIIRLSFQYESIVTRIRKYIISVICMYCACSVYAAAVRSNEPRAIIIIIITSYDLTLWLRLSKKTK